MAGLYFPHDVNDLADSKMIEMFGELDYWGYGVYYRIICILSNDGEHTLPCNYKWLSKILYVTDDKLDDLKRLITEFGLFVISDDGSHFWSERVLQQCQKLDAAAEAGKKGAAKRWANSNSNGEAITNPNRVPNSPPNRVPNRVPNGEAITDPNSPSEKEKEKEERKERTKEKKEEKEKESIAADAAITRACTREEAAAAAEQNLDTQTVDPNVQALLDAIGKRFNTIPLPAHLTALEALIAECNRPGVVNGVNVVRDGLARLDNAEAIKSGKVRLSITQFLQPKYFTRLISGDYDKTYNSKRKGGYAGAGISFEGREY